MADQAIGDPRAQSLLDTAGFQKHAPPFLADEGALKELKDTFGYGEGFLTVCLAYCNNDAQQAADMLLEDNLPKELAHVDKQMPRPCAADLGHHGPLMGDPRNAWLSGTFERVPESAGKDASADQSATRFGNLGDPRAAWVHAGEDITPHPVAAKQEINKGPKDIEDARARRA